MSTEPIKINVVQELIGPNDNGGYQKLQAWKTDDGPIVYLTFKSVAFSSLIKYKKLDAEGKNLETDEEAFHRIWLAQRIHECRDELEFDESDRVLTKRAIAQVQVESPWVMFICWRILERKSQTDHQELVTQPEESNIIPPDK